MRPIDNANRQVLSEQRIFPLIFISTIRQIFCLTPLLLMRIWCQIVPLWIPFEPYNFSFRLQPNSPIEVTSKIWISIIAFSVVRRPSLPFIVLHVDKLTISCFLWLTVFSPNTNTYPLGSLLTKRNFPHSQKASENDFHGPFGLACSRRSDSRARRVNGERVKLYTGKTRGRGGGTGGTRARERL